MASSQLAKNYWRSLARQSSSARRELDLAKSNAVPALSMAAAGSMATSRNTNSFSSSSSTSSSVPSEKKKEKVVVLGSGWAGYGFARALDPRKFERIVVSPRSYFVFTPLLASTSVGTLEFRSVLEPVRRLGVDRFHQGWADDIDFARKVIRVESNTADEVSSHTLPGQRPPAPKGQMIDVPYDKLIIAVGAYSQTFGIEGVKEYANFLRDVGDARSIRLRVLQCFEKASAPSPSVTDEQRRKLLHFAVVGGGPTGIEFAAELHDLIHDDLSKMYPDLMPFVSITIYDIAPKVLPMFDKQLSAYAIDMFKRQGIQVKTEHHLQRIRPDEDGKGGLLLKIKEAGDKEVGAGVVVWSTGLMQNPLIQSLVSKEIRLASDHGTLGGASGKVHEAGSVVRAGTTGTTTSHSALHIQKAQRSGGITVDPHLRVRLTSSTTASPIADSETSTTATQISSLLPDVYAMGDCAVIEDHPLPATAQVANQQAAYLAKALNKATSNGSDGLVQGKPFKFRNWGTMAYLGSWRAIHQSSADELKGRAAWILWRTAYLTKSMSIRNKIMVPVYWALTWIFGRDISRF